ncbi:hybrid sensor histidine kinase/response regulator [Pedobacter frigiditerrae]|uniref:histidine kinase n=1 Tax=Pedobacter frigiditerrae TaxID=2530452 RepID=A0A4V2MHX8_9SPHI|nr:ATP-binding protein [Pedobacter frigiditerrae]TCC88236.1 hybrid sensor histidine kinase/response regulator [Pedobacter frigiditerrae]
MIQFKEEHWELLFNSIDEGFCIIEMIFDEQEKPIDYRFLVINSSFEKQTKLNNAVGKRMREFAPNHEEHWFETYGKIALTGESVRFENYAEQLNCWYDVYAFRFGDPKNLQVAILFNNITERKQSEEQIKLLNKELAERVCQLEFANKELDAFSYSVSHDLRAPLGILNSFIKILADELSGNLTEEISYILGVMNSTSQKMENLIKDMLVFSHISKSEIERKEINTQQIVNNIVEDFCKQHFVEKTIFKIGDLPPSNGNSSMLNQVWTNLISNAYKYSKKKSPQTIEIGSKQNVEETTYYIKDNGVGFDMQSHQKLFGIFQRLHSDSEFEGAGIGLAIVQRIITRHEGKVWADAKVNEGATFYFTIPA